VPDLRWSERIAAVHGGSSRPAVIAPAGQVSGAELLGRATAAADLLVDLGVPAGVPVPALLTTGADSLALVLGGGAAGRPLAPLGPRLTAAELIAPVRATASPVLLTEPEWAARAAEVAASTGVRVVEVPTLRPSASPPAAPPTEIALVLHTSGTTGAARPVPITHGVLEARARLSPELLGLGPTSRYASGSPLHHIGGLGNTLVALSVGAAVLPTRRFSTDWYASLREVGVTHCTLVPSMIEMLWEEGRLGAAGVSTIVYGASPIRPATLARARAALPGVRLVQLFGQTEGSPLTCLTAEDHERAARGAPELLATVGAAVPGLSLRLEAPDAAGAGEVLAAAPHLSACAADGWLHTGDVGLLERHDGRDLLRLVGRRNDMVVRGGENVYPVEVEHVLAGHPGVAAVGIVGVPDDRLVETLAAFVVPADPDRPPELADLHAFTRARLAGFKVPTHWHIVEALPTNSAGKLLRPALRPLHTAT
jgi:acyl-CoA synthetase (AMP-forming)/AMP-acid ligase II